MLKIRVTILFTSTKRIIYIPKQGEIQTVDAYLETEKENDKDCGYDGETDHQHRDIRSQPALHLKNPKSISGNI